MKLKAQAGMLHKSWSRRKADAGACSKTKLDLFTELGDGGALRTVSLYKRLKLHDTFCVCMEDEPIKTNFTIAAKDYVSYYGGPKLRRIMQIQSRPGILYGLSTTPAIVVFVACQMMDEPTTIDVQYTTDLANCTSVYAFGAFDKIRNTLLSASREFMLRGKNVVFEQILTFAGCC